MSGMSMFLAQLETAVDAGSKVMQGRSDGVLFVIGAFIMVGVLLYFQNKDKKEAQTLESIRQEKEAQREERREQAEAERLKEQHADHVRFAERNATSLDVISRGMDRSSHAAEIMAATAKKTEELLETILAKLDRDRGAICCVLEHMLENATSDEQRAIFREALMSLRADIRSARKSNV